MLKLVACSATIIHRLCLALHLRQVFVFLPPCNLFKILLKTTPAFAKVEGIPGVFWLSHANAIDNTAMSQGSWWLSKLSQPRTTQDRAATFLCASAKELKFRHDYIKWGGVGWGGNNWNKAHALFEIRIMSVYMFLIVLNKRLLGLMEQ